VGAGTKSGAATSGKRLLMPHFDYTISIGNLITAFAFILCAVLAWRDMNWRVKNLEVWRKEHMVDADSRDQIITRMDKILFHVTNGREGAVEAWDRQERRKR
jgi:hypothetical protein